MTLKDDITALRALLEEQARSTRKAAAPSEPAAHPEEDPDRFEALMQTVSATIEDLGKEVDDHPRLTALTTFAIGLSLGMALSPRGR